MHHPARCEWFLALVLLLLAAPLAAQDLEPRRWTHLPVGANTFALGYAGQSADIYSNPLIGITDGTANINGWLARYTYSFDWAGTTARVDGMLPYLSGTWKGLVGGEPGQRTIRAGGDPWAKVRTEGGNEGWMLKRYLTSEPPLSVTVATLTNQKNKLAKKAEEMEGKYNELAGIYSQNEQELNTCIAERDKIKTDFQTLKKDTADVIKIKENLSTRTQEVQDLAQKLTTAQQEIKVDEKIAASEDGRNANCRFPTDYVPIDEDIPFQLVRQC